MEILLNLEAVEMAGTHAYSAKVDTGFAIGTRAN